MIYSINNFIFICCNKTMLSTPNYTEIVRKLSVIKSKMYKYGIASINKDPPQ